MKTARPKVKIVFPNLLLAFTPFIVLWLLKLSVCPDWSWILVTSPLWIYIAWCAGWLVLGVCSFLVVSKMAKYRNDGRQID